MIYTAVNSVKLQNNHVVPRLQQKQKMEKPSTGKCMKLKETQNTEKLFQKFLELIRACHYLSLYSFSCASNASAPLISITSKSLTPSPGLKKIHTHKTNLLKIYMHY